MNRYEDQVAAALGAVELRPPDAFLWFGRRESVGPDGTSEQLVQAIGARLHGDCFSAGAPRPRGGGPATPPDEGGTFVRALSQANGGRGAWQGGWRVAGTDADGDGALRVVRPDGLALLAPAEHVRAAGNAAADQPCATGEAAADQPGATGNAAVDQPRTTGEAAADQPGATGNAAADQPRITGKAPADQPRTTGKAPADQPRTTGNAVAGAAAPAAVLLPKELRGLSPGFYVAPGDSGAPDPDALAGLYWNVAPAGAVTLVARVTFALNGAGLPFALELRDNPARYGRGDAAVLLLARSDVPAALKLLRPLLRALGPHLAEPAPAFTKPLARGLALAEQPAGATRFGEHRCRLVAEAIVAAGAATAAERLAAVRERFAAAGLDLDAPYLQPGSTDAYA